MTDSAPHYAAPTKTDVEQVLARLVTLQLRRAFYSKLMNPLWVDALRLAGAFSNPPVMKDMGDGSYRVDPWPELDYLARMAPLVPAEVAAVLVAIPTVDAATKPGLKDNPWVRRGIWEATASLPAKEAASLVPKMKTWANEDANRFSADPRNISKVIVNLLKGGQHKAGAQLANAYYEPRPPSAKVGYGLGEPQTGLEPYWYLESLPRVAEALGSCRLRTLIRWLEKDQVHSGSYDAGSATDTSPVWRPLIDRSDSYRTHEIGGSLVEALRSAALDPLTQSPKAVGILLKRTQPLFRRIAVNVLAETIERVDEMPADACAALAELATIVLSDASYAESEYRPEYVRFVRACAAWPSADLSPLGRIINDGPGFLRDARREFWLERATTKNSSSNA